MNASKLLRRSKYGLIVAVQRARKKKGRSCERPKSREETPKEGCDAGETGSTGVATQYLTVRRTKATSVFA